MANAGDTIEAEHVEQSHHDDLMICSTSHGRGDDWLATLFSSFDNDRFVTALFHSTTTHTDSTAGANQSREPSVSLVSSVKGLDNLQE